MLSVLSDYPNTLAPVRKFSVKADFVNSEAAFNGSYTQADRIQSFDIQRVGEDSKFFGFGIVQRLNLKLRDNLEELDIPANTKIVLTVRCGTDKTVTYPPFYVYRVNRDENTGQLSITAYDALYHAKDTLFVRDYSKNNHMLGVWIADAAGSLGFGGNSYSNQYIDISDRTQLFNKTINDPNFDGTESVKDVLDSIAEYTQCIYYLNKNQQIVFRRLNRDGDPLLTISKSDYFTLKSSDNRRLQTIAHITELGDNVSASTTSIGSTQYIKDNPWYETTAVIEDRLQAGIDVLGNISINQFECSWRGFPALEIGDKIAIETKTGAHVITYILNDTVEYDGALKESSSWKYTEGEATAATPHTIGEAIRDVYAKVDRVNKNISLVVSEKVKEEIQNGTFDADIKEVVDQEMSKIEIDTDGIKASVMESTQELIDSELVEIKQQVSMNMTKEDVEILIENSKTTGTEKVETTTGYKFDQDGLTVSKSGSDMSTTITEDGMIITRDDDPVLVANNEGVKAEDLHATTYLIIGLNSRFEDYDNGKRTGCFWIGD